MTERNPEQIIRQCTRFVPGHYPVLPHEMFRQLAEMTPPDLSADRYGGGKVIADFEAQVAKLLGKPAAVFMPSGTMAQQIALRIHADHSGNQNVAFHPTCHLEIHEKNAYRDLHQLKGITVGSRDYLMTLDDLKNVNSPIGTLLLELPQREIGGILPSWDELIEITDYARIQGTSLHLDGARLWESQPFYGRSYAGICSLFDSIYVSFYKILGGITGAMLLGEKWLIDEARVWQKRHGGNLYKMYPYVLSAKMGLDKHLSQMNAYHDKALAIANALSEIDGIEIKPNPPHTNMMHIYFRRDSKRLWETILDIAEESQTLLMNRPRPAEIPAYSKTELSIGEAALDLQTEEVATLYGDLMKRSL